MKKHLLSLACLILASILGSSCRLNVLRGEGNKVENSPAVAPFTAVDIDLPLKAVITLQDGVQPGLTISGYENLLKHIKVKSENNKLRLYTDLDETWTMDYKDISVHITLPVITELSLEGATDADVHGSVTGSQFRLGISGASSVVIDNMNVDNFSSGVSGAGGIVIKGGSVKHAAYEIDGAGRIKAFPLQAEETSANISGAGKGEFTALQELTASISGAGIIKYKGHPSVTKQVSGAGVITDAN